MDEDIQNGDVGAKRARRHGGVSDSFLNHSPHAAGGVDGDIFALPWRICTPLLLPALRIAEFDPEYAAVAAARLIEQNGTVELAHFAGDE